MVDATVAPPVVELGRLAGTNPLPVSVRDARRSLTDFRSSLPPAPTILGAPRPVAAAGPPALVLRDVGARYGRTEIFGGVSMTVVGGEVMALMGRNGAGKSTLLSVVAGLRRTDGGEVLVNGDAPADLRATERIRRVALVPSDPSLLLVADRVDDECRANDRDAGLPDGTTATRLDELVALDPDRHPRDLSEGQRLALALAIVLAPEPGVVLLDEPTRGLDYAAKRRLVAWLHRLARSGHAVVLATHDVELAAEVATRVAILADGEIVVDGPARSVLTDSPLFAPQVARILAPERWLTVTELAAALA
jgi:ABC-type multidrug transport system ATPase subunit